MQADLAMVMDEAYPLPEKRSGFSGELKVAGLLDWMPGFGGRGREYEQTMRELKATPPPHSALKDGDIIFQKSKSEQSKFIDMATDNPLTHVGIVFREKDRKGNEKLVVYEAVQPVKKTPLDSFIARGEEGNYLVRRLKDADKALDEKALSKMKSFMDSHLGKNYDSHFMWSNDRQYCSELVWKAYAEATGKKLGEPMPMGSYRLGDKELREAIEKRWGRKLPLDELMIAPSSIYKSRLLEPVKK